MELLQDISIQQTQATNKQKPQVPAEHTLYAAAMLFRQNRTRARLTCRYLSL